MNQHRLIMNAAAIKHDWQNYNQYDLETAHQYQLFYQMTRLTRDRGALRHDDRLDALALVVANWMESIDRDVESTEAAHREQLRDIDLEKFMDSVLGVSSRGPTMLDSSTFLQDGDEYSLELD